MKFNINLFVFKSNVIIIARNLGPKDRKHLALHLFCLDVFDKLNINFRIQWEIKQIGAILEKNFVNFEEILIKSGNEI